MRGELAEAVNISKVPDIQQWVYKRSALVFMRFCLGTFSLIFLAYVIKPFLLG
ncbi:hypothetical protein [Syntrophomonas palmitatica]|uniref:hypothetical protein n=1 Tax=Syntrophomonas palmitatica TaxID=402877 RepID=UPI001FA6D593|nr:hypothetical protein [Syntrophomonas palmitatica]